VDKTPESKNLSLLKNIRSKIDRAALLAWLNTFKRTSSLEHSYKFKIRYKSSWNSRYSTSSKFTIL